MIADGLIQEAEKLHQYKHSKCTTNSGLESEFAHFEGNTTKEEAIEEIKRIPEDLPSDNSHGLKKIVTFYGSIISWPKKRSFRNSQTTHLQKDKPMFIF